MPAPLIASYPALSLTGLEALARSLAVRAELGDVVTLAGDLGSGKSSFARAFIQALAPAGTQVTSPTFTLMQNYDITLADGKPATAWHLDLYRLEDAGEIEALGLEELWPHVVLIEWPQLAQAYLPASRLDITLDFTADAVARDLYCYGEAGWAVRLEGMQAA